MKRGEFALQPQPSETFQRSRGPLFLGRCGTLWVVSKTTESAASGPGPKAESMYIFTFRTLIGPVVYLSTRTFSGALEYTRRWIESKRQNERKEEREVALQEFG